MNDHGRAFLSVRIGELRSGAMGFHICRCGVAALATCVTGRT